jgi:gamma-glutamylcysteine synthetase
MGDIKKYSDYTKKNLDEIELLEDLTSTGTWYLDLRSMKFTEISENIFELYGISKGDSTSYESFLFDCVLMDDQTYCEQKRLEIMNAKGPAKFQLEFRIIRQNTGAIHKQRVLVQRVEDEEGNLIGLRGAEMDLGIVEA